MRCAPLVPSARTTGAVAVPAPSTRKFPEMPALSVMSSPARRRYIAASSPRPRGSRRPRPGPAPRRVRAARRAGRCPPAAGGIPGAGECRGQGTEVVAAGRAERGRWARRSGSRRSPRRTPPGRSAAPPVRPRRPARRARHVDEHACRLNVRYGLTIRAHRSQASRPSGTSLRVEDEIDQSGRGRVVGVAVQAPAGLSAAPPRAGRGRPRARRPPPPAPRPCA